MESRITIISLFSDLDESKIKNLLKNVNIPLCKVPFKKDIENRFLADTMPFHMTLSADNITNEQIVTEKLNELEFSETSITIDKLDILPGKENSYVLVFNVLPNKELTAFQEKIYKVLPTPKYNPKEIKFHITIHISKNYDEIIYLKNNIEINFKPLKLTIDKIGLYKIWPPRLIKEYSCIKNI